MAVRVIGYSVKANGVKYRIGQIIPGLTDKDEARLVQDGYAEYIEETQKDNEIVSVSKKENISVLDKIDQVETEQEEQESHPDAIEENIEDVQKVEKQPQKPKGSNRRRGK